MAVLHLGIALLLAALPATNDGVDFTGRWKLVATTTDAEEFFIVDLTLVQGKLAATVVDPPALLRGPVAPRAYCEVEGDAIVILVTAYQGDWIFKGTRPKGDVVDRIPGAYQFGMLAANTAYVNEGRLEKTEADRVAKKKPIAAGDEGSMGLVATMRFVAASSRSTTELRRSCYLPLDLKVAVAADRNLPFDAATGTRAWSATRLLAAATMANEPKLASEAKGRRDKLMAMFAQEERKQVGPLVVEPFAGPRPAGEDRVVLMEQFLCAEGPESIREGLAFDALATAYKPTELIAIQYHLHTPGPDPLASPDSLARGKSYEVTRTPTKILDGRRLPRSSGLDEAPRKYNEYRRQVDHALEGKRRATIELRVSRKGDVVALSAVAKLLPGAKPEGRAKMRLVLTEDDVPYVSALGLNHYRRVARSMPGGVAGVVLRDGVGRMDSRIKLDALQDELERDLRQGPGDGPGLRGEFRGGVPPIFLKRLSLVAFVQDELGDVLHAEIVAVPEPGTGQGAPAPK